MEAHGTGTRSGDPIEAQALLSTYGLDRPEGRPLWLGSVKSNIGHAMAAAGVSGVIKMVMAMRHGTLPKTLHVDEPSTRIDWSAGEVELLSESSPWPETEAPRRAAVSSFGMTGTNVHAIIEEARDLESRGSSNGSAPRSGTGREQRRGGASGESATTMPDGDQASQIPCALVSLDSVPWVLSGKGEVRAARSGRHSTHISRNPGPDIRDVGLSLACSRSALESRAVVIGHEPRELLAALTELSEEGSAPGVLRGTARPGKGHVAFMFTGQGAQRVGMGRELYDASPVFKDALDEVCQSFDPLLGRSLREIILGKGDRRIQRGRSRRSVLVG